MYCECVLYVCVLSFLLNYVYVGHTMCAQKCRRLRRPEIATPLNCSYRVQVWVVEFELRSTGKAVHALNSEQYFQPLFVTSNLCALSH